MPGLAAIITGTCSGHGVPIPANIHNPGQGRPCGPTGVACPPIWCNTLPLTVKDASCQWPPAALTLLAPIPRNVLINGTVPVLDGDALILHKSPTTNLVEQKAPTPKAGCTTTITTATCNCSILTKEDNMGAGHSRIVVATTATVFVNGKRLAAVGDGMVMPCKSRIASGSANVMVGK